MHVKVEKCVPVYTYEERIHEVIKEKLVVSYEQTPVEIIREILVREEVIREVPVNIEKVVPVLHIVEETQIEYLYEKKPEPYPFNEAVYVNTEVPIDRPVHVVAREEVAL